jgi:centromeric protein E
VSSWTVLNDKNAVVQTANTGNPLPAKKGRTYFNYTKTFDGEASNGQVYDGICQKTVSALVQGINGTIIAYGQTGSGKSHTMQGGNSSETGMIHMAALDIFNQIESCPQRTFVVCVSMFELYNQEINDLLSNETISSLQDPKTRMLVDASEKIVVDYASFVNLFDSCNEGRKLRNTDMNKKSSRSHTIYRITVESRPVTDSSKEPLNDDKMCRSTLYLVDLAGSDTSKGTMTKKSNMLNSNQKEEKKLQLEANHINKR